MTAVLPSQYSARVQEHSRAEGRVREWFVPNFGPMRFRVWVGLLFLPYTAMVLAFTVVGAMLAPVVHWDRVGALLLIYLLALGIGAHALDALGQGGNRPWGESFTKTQLLVLAGSSVIAAYAVGIYYMIAVAPLLWPIAILEGFFLLAYNLEWFSGRFHTDGWFAFSWGALPALAGYVLQANTIAPAAILAAAAAAALSIVEIKASRPYKLLKQEHGHEQAQIRQYEHILKAVSATSLLLALSLVWFRLPK